jgi:hypothetical protein
MKDYPSIVELKNYIYSKNPSYQMEVQNDIIRFWI